MTGTDIPEEVRRELIQKALEVRRNAYAPYSHYKVGAALLTADGTIVTGCNVESAAFGVGQCAERCALTKAVSEGVREFRAIAIVAALDSALDLATNALRCLQAGPPGVCGPGTLPGPHGKEP